MRTVVCAFTLLLLATLPAQADPPAFRASRAPIKVEATADSGKAGRLGAAPEPAPGAGPAKGACDLATDPATLTHWLAYKQLDQWVPCDPEQAIDVPFLVQGIADAAQAHFCAPQQPITRQMGASTTELGHLRCAYAGQDLAAGRKSGKWEVKPLPAAVPYRLASLTEPIAGPARLGAPAVAEIEAADKASAAASAAKPAKPAKSNKVARAGAPAAGR